MSIVMTQRVLCVYYMSIVMTHSVPFVYFMSVVIKQLVICENFRSKSSTFPSGIRIKIDPWYPWLADEAI